MNYSSINIQGHVISSEILEKIRTDEMRYQKAADFGLPPNVTVRDEISLAWSQAVSHWSALKARRELLKATDTGTEETRKYWMIPLLHILGYEPARSNAEIINGKSYAISHRCANREHFPIHLVGINQNLDKRAETGGPRLSPHALMQEYLNNTEHNYGLVANGRTIRLLRDATRLSKLSYLEFDLEQIMEQSMYVEFALLYRVLHATRMPAKADDAESCIMEFYHQEALDAGSRIRARLSEAVESSLRALANGLLRHPGNEALRKSVSNGDLKADLYFLYTLRLVYRMLFLLVIEERKLIYPDKRDAALNRLRDIYYQYYSVQRLARLAERKTYVDPRKGDLWQSLLATFGLFEESKHGSRLGISALGSGLFDPEALGLFKEQQLDNASLLAVLRLLVTFTNENGQLVRVNYADLDVEEFGSVYEGLLEFDPCFKGTGTTLEFGFMEGKARSSSGSHYTPEELVKPLITHSLDYLIADRLKEADPEKALLSLTICDVACGSGHILLSAARRVGFELAKYRSKEDQPTPTALRAAVRDVIRHCIYGVDLNPLAVELCKVALWLEAHDPGQPLNFLDHHIKCGNAIVGLAHMEELEKGIASEAFKALPGDDKTIAAAFRKRNEQELKTAGQLSTFDVSEADNDLKDVQHAFGAFTQLPESTPEQIALKAKAYRDLTNGKKWWRLKQLADLQVAQFFIPKTTDNREKLTTQSQYKTYLKQGTQIMDRGASLAMSSEKRFFHWFLEFPEVFGAGGFDCILGNPPFLGGKKITTAFGERNFSWIKYLIPEKGSSDLVGYFFRRIFQILKKNGFQSLIASNTISQGDTREVCLDVILNNQGEIVYGNKNIDWPGVAAVSVTLISIHKGKWFKERILRATKVNNISAYIDDSESNLIPFVLKRNADKTFIGNTVLGKGFILEDDQAASIIRRDPIYKDVITPYLSGDDLNTNPDQTPSRQIIYFRDWPEEICRNKYPICWDILVAKVKPQRDELIIKSKQIHTYNFWEFWDLRPKMYKAIEPLKSYFAISRVTKQVSLTKVIKGAVPSEQTVVFAFDDFQLFCILSSTLHDAFAWKNSSTMGANTLRYSPTDCYETFPFPPKLNQEQDQQFLIIGETYHEQRHQLMLGIQLGLTKTYNLFHSRGITATQVDESDKQVMALRKHLANTPGTDTFEKAIEGIRKLRQLHVEMDEAVLEAYTWSDIQLRHDFYEVDYLPENDRVRYTIHPDARKEVLKRLLALNHQIHEEEVKAGLWDKKGAVKAGKKGKKGQEELF
jgi:methylase of polypeptide subunit release factors